MGTEPNADHDAQLNRLPAAIAHATRSANGWNHDNLVSRRHARTSGKPIDWSQHRRAGGTAYCAGDFEGDGMKAIRVACDGCEKDLSSTDFHTEFRLVLTSESIPHTGMTRSAMIPDYIISRDHHFCSLKCLKTWVERRIGSPTESR